MLSNTPLILLDGFPKLFRREDFGAIVCGESKVVGIARNDVICGAYIGKFQNHIIVCVSNDAEFESWRVTHSTAIYLSE